MIVKIGTPATAEIAAAGVSYALRVGDFANSFNDFCQVTAVYDTRP